MINRNPVVNLKYYRELKGFSQKELAEKIQTSQGYISEIEKNIKSPTIRMLYNLACALEICPRLLLSCIIEQEDDNFIKCECELNVNENCYIQQKE
jgi:transcriptional regulator with XRE-family HTH domain